MELLAPEKPSARVAGALQRVPKYSTQSNYATETTAAVTPSAYLADARQVLHPDAVLIAIDRSLRRLERRGRRLLTPAFWHGTGLDRFDRELAALSDALDHLSAACAREGPADLLPALKGRFLRLARAPHPGRSGGAPLPESLPALIEAAVHHCTRLATTCPDALPEALQVLVELLFHWQLWLYLWPTHQPGFAPQPGDALAGHLPLPEVVHLIRGALERFVLAPDGSRQIQAALHNLTVQSPDSTFR